MYTQEIDLRANTTVTAEVKAQMDNSPVVSPVYEGMGIVNDLQSIPEALNNSTDSYKENTAIIKEFGDALPEIIKNLRMMNDAVVRNTQNLPAIKHTFTDAEKKGKRQSDILNQSALNLINNGNGIVQSYANGNVGGAVSGVFSGASNLLNNSAKLAENSDMADMAKTLGGLGVGVAIAGAVVKGVDDITNKYIDEMPTLFATGRAFGDMSNSGSMIAYQKLNEKNIGTNLNVTEFQTIAQALRKQGLGNDLNKQSQLDLVGNVAQTTSRWAYATGGDANQYAQLAGIMSRYGGSKNVAEDFNFLVSAGKASGLNDTQIPEFLSGIQKVMEDGIANGFTRSATDVASTLLMFSKLSNNNPFWQGEQGAKLLNQANRGLAGATSLSKTSDIIAYQAISEAYSGTVDEIDKKTGKKTGRKISKEQAALGNDLYLEDGGYINKMMLLEQGLNKDNFGTIMKSVQNTTGDKKQQIEILRDMFGVNYTGASRIMDLYEKNGGKVSDAEIDKILEAPENQNNEIRHQKALNDIKAAVVNVGEGLADIKISGMSLISDNVQKITDKIAGSSEDRKAEEDFLNIYNSLSKEQKRELNEVIPTFANKQEKLAYAQWYINGQIGMPNVNSDSIYSDYQNGKLRSSVRWGKGTLFDPRDLTEMPKYIQDTYETEIIKMFDGNVDEARTFEKALEDVKRFTDRVVKETSDTSIKDAEKKETITLLQELVDQVKAGITYRELK